MVIKQLDLKQFRNYENQNLKFNKKFNFIYGNNGQGKTNILEAISYSAFTKSFLGSSETDCIMFGKKDFLINAKYENDLGNTDSISVSYSIKNEFSDSSKPKTILLNSEKISSYSSELFGRYPVVFMNPRSLNITYGNPSERRKFFDIVISQTSRLYLDYLKDLSKILKQKNSLLRDFSKYNKYSLKVVRDIASAYNESLADVSSHIVFKRLNFLNEFIPVFKKNFSSLITKENEPEIIYKSDPLNSAGEEMMPEPDINYIKQIIGSYIQSNLDEEIKRGIAITGPQRDDYIFRLKKENGNFFFDLKNFASQGEHKTFLIALKLSEFDYLKDKRATTPILMLDDVLSELDESRVSKIISHLNEFGQIFLTTTDKNYLGRVKEFYEPDDINVFKVDSGRAFSE
jgi:DNA replication and repair protein RecF